MPNMADITVKKYDGSTDITWTAQTPSSGDKTAAVWRSNSVGSAVAFRPLLQMSVQSNQAGTARRISIKGSYPQTYTNSTTSLDSVANNIPFDLSMTLPNATPASYIDEAVAQFANLLKSSLIQSAMTAGIAPT